MAKQFIVVETYQDYKHVSANIWFGAKKTKEEAKKNLRKAIEERYNYMLEDDDYDFEAFYKGGFVEDENGEEIWEDDNPDCYELFRIEEIEVED